MTIQTITAANIGTHKVGGKEPANTPTRRVTDKRLVANNVGQAQNLLWKPSKFPRLLSNSFAARDNPLLRVQSYRLLSANLALQTLLARQLTGKRTLSNNVALQTLLSRSVTYKRLVYSPNPGSIANLAVWFKADSGTFQDTGLTTAAINDGDVVGGWQDFSGNNYHALQSTSIAKPLLKVNQVNSRPAILFDGVNDYLLTTYTSAVVQTGSTIYLVMQTPASGPVPEFIFEQRRSTDGVPISSIWINGVGTNLKARGRTDGSGAINDTSGLAGNTSWALVEFHWDGQIITITQGANNQTVNQVGGTETIDGTSFACTGIADSAPASGFANVYIGEFLHFSRALSAVERGQVKQYLNNRWFGKTETAGIRQVVNRQVTGKRAFLDRVALRDLTSIFKTARTLISNSVGLRKDPVGLLAYWGLHDVGGANLNWVDDTGNFPMTAGATTVTSAPGLYGTSADFTYTAGSVLTNTNPVITAPPFTITAWARVTDNTHSHVIYSQSTGATVRQYLLVGSSGNVRLRVASGGLAEVTTANGLVLPNVWTHVAATYDASNVVNIYVNGVLQLTDSPTGSWVSAGTNTLVGGDVASDLWQGQLQNVSVWNRVLSVQEIGKINNLPGLVWRTVSAYRTRADQFGLPDAELAYALRRLRVTDNLGLRDLTHVMLAARLFGSIFTQVDKGRTFTQDDDVDFVQVDKGTDFLQEPD